MPGVKGRPILKEKPTQDAASGAAAPDVMVVIQGLLFASSHTCVMRSPFFFQHVGDHLAISPSHLVEDNLRISCLLEFLYLSCEVLSALLEVFHVRVGGMNLKPYTRFEDVCVTRRV